MKGGFPAFFFAHKIGNHPPVGVSLLPKVFLIFVLSKENKIMVSNFTEKEIGYIARAIGKSMTLRITYCGNIIVKHLNSTKILFGIYKRENGILIRRRLGYENPFGSGNVLNGGKELPTLKVAMKYFKGYMAKYPNSLKG